MDANGWVIERYDGAENAAWNEFVNSSRNATFLFRREYMEYHADRVTDCSLVARKKGKILALLPANRKDNGLFSHGGLTYGGWILPPGKVNGMELCSLFEVWLEWCRNEGINAIHYKPLPFIYACQPAQEDLYALWRFGAVKERLQLSAAIDLSCNPGFDYRRRRYLPRVEEKGVVVKESDRLDRFWEILTECLKLRHNAAPVHSLAEISRLKSLFEKEIRIFVLCDDEGMQAGVLTYCTGMVQHCQYIATTQKAREERYLPFLFKEMINMCQCRYFDMGTSTDQNDCRLLDAGLLDNKFGFGATGVAYEQYLLRP